MFIIIFNNQFNYYEIGYIESEYGYNIPEFDSFVNYLYCNKNIFIHEDEHVCDAITKFLSEYYEKEGYKTKIESRSKYRLGNKLHISYS